MRPAIIYGALLLLSLLAAWVQWTSDPVVDSGDQVVLLAGDLDTLERIEWKGEDGNTVLTRKSDEHGDYLWIDALSIETRKIKPPPTPKVEGEGEPAAEDAPPSDPAVDPIVNEEKIERTSAFKGSEKGDEVLAAFSPLMALRKLDASDPAKLAEIGLDAPKGTITVVRRGKSTVLSVGGEAYGTKHRYLRNDETGEVFLVEENRVKDLQHARTRLADRSLWSLATPAIGSVVLTVGEKSLELSQKNPDDEAKTFWARAGMDSRDEEATAWMDKLLKLRGVSYVDPSADDAPKELAPRLTVELRPAGKGKSEILEVLEDSATGEFYGRSPHTRGLLKMLKAPTRGAVEDVGPLLP